MEVGVVDSFDFEPWWEVVVVFWHLAASQDVHLRLHGDCRALGDTVDIDAIVGGQEWIRAVSKAASLFVGVEAGFGESCVLCRNHWAQGCPLPRCQEILLLRSQHFRLLFEHKKFVSM